jgi:hypothetical protein
VDKCRFRDGSADLAHQEAVSRADASLLRYQSLGNLASYDIVDFADMGHGVFASGRFVRHGPVWCDQAIASVASADLTVIARLRGRPRYGQIDCARLRMVGRVHTHAAFWKETGRCGRT